MASRKRYTFIKKEQSKGGKLSMTMALVSLFLFVADVIVSAVLGGKAPYIIGVIALVAMLFAGYGLYLGLQSFSERKVSFTYSIIGSLGCGVLVIAWLTLFLTGIR